MNSKKSHIYPDEKNNLPSYPSLDKNYDDTIVSLDGPPSFSLSSGPSRPSNPPSSDIPSIEYNRSVTGTFIWFTICLLHLYQILNCPSDKTYQKSVSIFLFMKCFSICWVQSSSSTILFRHFVGTSLVISPLLLGEYCQIWSFPISIISITLFFKLNHPIARHFTPLWTYNTDKELLEAEFGEKEENMKFSTHRSIFGTIIYVFFLLSLFVNWFSIYIDGMEDIDKEFIRILLTALAGTFTLSSILSPRITICRPRIRFIYLGFFWMLFLNTIDLLRFDEKVELLVVFILLFSVLPVIVGLMNKPTSQISRFFTPFYVIMERKKDGKGGIGKKSAPIV